MTLLLRHVSAGVIIRDCYRTILKPTENYSLFSLNVVYILYVIQRVVFCDMSGLYLFITIYIQYIPWQQGSCGPSGARADRTQVGPMLAPWTLLSGYTIADVECESFVLNHWGSPSEVISSVMSIICFPPSFALISPSGISARPVFLFWGI